MAIEFKGWWKCIPADRIVALIMRGRKVVRFSMGNFTFLSRRSPIAAVTTIGDGASVWFYTDMTGEKMSFESKISYDNPSRRYQLLLPDGCGNEWIGLDVTVHIEVIPIRSPQMITRETANDIVMRGGSVRAIRYFPYGPSSTVISHHIEKLRDYDEFMAIEKGDSNDT